MSEKHLAALMERYPAIIDLQKRALGRMPHVAREYLESGTGDESGVSRNLAGMAQKTLVPRVLQGDAPPDLSTTLFGQAYRAPFGIGPVGLTGLMWPRGESILAASAAKYGIPYCLSTVATQTPEVIGPIAGDMGWFQLYTPREAEVCADLLQRARGAGFKTLMVTIDTPVGSRRERTVRAGLHMPPRITPGFVGQALRNPSWTLQTLKAGLPRLRTLEKYTGSSKMGATAAFVEQRMGGARSWEDLKRLRDQWRGPMVAKGVHHPEDAELALGVGVDGIQVSNHGARQFDGAPAAIDLLPAIVRQVQGKTSILFDSGIRGGLDIIRALALGADFVFLGRAYIYGVAALGRYGGDHTTEILLADLHNNMIQLGCGTLADIAGLSEAVPQRMPQRSGEVAG